MRHALVISLMLGSAGPAAALAPPWSVCNNADGTTSEFMATFDADDAVFPNMTTFTVHAADKQGSVTEVIAHCSSGQAVSWVEAEDGDTRRKISDLIENNPRITLRQLANRINRLGVKARFGQLDKGICACDPTAYYNSF